MEGIRKAEPRAQAALQPELHSYIADFHIHSLLSPCAEVEMTPHHLMLRARAAGVQVVALTDHNSSGNLPALIRLASEYGIKVFPGMEVECREEAHILVLFDKMRQLSAWQRIVDQAHSGLKNKPERFGAQFIVDEEDNFVAEEDRLLLGPIGLSAEQVVQQATALGGMCIAAHIDKPSYSLLVNLGFLPPDLGLQAAEISKNHLEELQEGKLRGRAGNLPYITNSDAHRMEEFLQGPKNRITVADLTLAELKLALAGREGRSWQAGILLK